MAAPNTIEGPEKVYPAVISAEKSAIFDMFVGFALKDTKFGGKKHPIRRRKISTVNCDSPFFIERLFKIPGR
jgi:hypothetical protein